MWDWDPMADNDDKGPVFLETVDVEGASAPIVKDDLDRTMKMVYLRVLQDEPWQMPPDTSADMSWHKPTCTLEKWGHTDVKVKLSEGSAYFTLNRPQDNNVLNSTILAGLCDAVFLLYEKKESIRVAVFTGEGKMFCGGGVHDGSGFNTSPKDPALQEAFKKIEQKATQGGAFPGGKVDMGRMLQAKLYHSWISLPQFTICLCNGSAMGDGLSCVTVCDMAIAVKSAFFVVSQVKLGLIPANLSPYIVAKVGSSNAKKMFCLSENMTAAKAKDNQLINEVVDNMEAGHKMINDICKRLTECGPKTVTFAKEVIHSVSGQAMSESLMFYACSQLCASQASEEARTAAKLGASAKKPWEEKPIKVLF